MSLDKYISDMAKRMAAGPSSTAISTPEATAGKTSSLNNYISNMAKRVTYKSIGFDTLGADLSSIANGAVSYLEGGWSDQNANAAQKQSLTDLISRLKSAKQYYTANASQFEGDVNKSIEEIDKALASLTELSGYVDEVGKVYSNYGSREEYDANIAAAKFMEWSKDKTTAELEGMISDIKLAQWGYEQNGTPYKIHAVSNDTYSTYLPYLESQLANKQIQQYVDWAKQQADFEEKSNPGGVLKHSNGKGAVDISARVNGTANYDDVESQDLIGYYNNFTAAVVNADDAKFYPMMTSDEIKTFNYIRRTQGDEAAIKYHDALYSVLDDRYKEKLLGEKEKFAQNHPWLATGQAILEGVFLSPITFMSNTIDALSGKGYNENSALNIMGSANDLIFSTVPEAWAKKYGWDEGTKGAVSLLYSTGVSIVQNVATAALFGGYTGTAIGGWTALAAIGTQAANSTMREMAAKGATDAQIYALGIISGVAEGLMEKIPLDKLVKLGKGGKTGVVNTIKSILKQSGDEFLEESATEIVNILADAVIRLGDSDLAQAIQQDGLGKALHDTIGDILMAGASGALSGGVMGSAFTLYGNLFGADTVQLRQSGKFIMDNGAADILIQQGLKLGQGSEAHELATLLQKRAANNGGQLKSSSAVDVGRLYMLETELVREQYMQSATDKISAQLEAAGIKSEGKVTKLAGAVARIIAGEGTKADARAVTRSKEATAIVVASTTSLDPSVAWNPIAKNTVYKLSDKSLMIISRQGTSNVYNVSFAYDGETETAMNMDGRTVRQVEGMIERAREGADIDGIVSGLKGQVSTGEAVENTLESAMAHGVSDNIVNLALALTEATGGDLRIMFDPKLAGTGNRGAHKNYYDGTRLARIAPNIEGIISTIAHELFHDLENTAAGKAFIKAAVEYAKNSPAKDSANGSNRYEEVVKLYKKQNPTTSQEDLLTEVAAKVAGELLMDEKALTAVLESMKPSDVESLGTKLKRAANALKRKLKGIKNAKPVETQVDVLLKLYNKAFAQRVIQDAVENPVVGDPAAEAKKLAAETAKKAKSGNKKELTSMNEEDMQVSSESEKEKAPEREKYSLRGVASDGKKIYESNFPMGTPKVAKSERILDYIQNVWSKNPIKLVVSNGETSRTILAQFDPYVDETQNTPTDASKIAGGNRHGNHTEQRVTLDLADDYYEIASDAVYNYSKLETGKDLETHEDVKMWHYFINEIYFAEYGEDKLSPYTVTINVKERETGDFVYSFNAEKEFSTQRTLHAAVNTYHGANGELFLDKSIPQNQDLSTGKSDIAEKNAQKTVFGTEKSVPVSPEADTYGVKYCLTEAHEIGNTSIKYNDRHDKVNAAVLKVGVEVMMEMAEIMKPYLDEGGILPPDTNKKNGKTLFKNGSYGRTAENTTVCVRTLTYEDFKDRVAEELGRPLTVAESLLVSQKIYDVATDPQCIYCYVAADRKAYDEYLGEYQKAMDKYIKAIRNGGDSKALYEEYLDGRKDTDAQKKRWASWEKIAKSGAKYLSASDLTTKAKRDAIIKQGGAIADQVKDAQRYAQSASWAKKVEDYRAYNGEILRLTEQLVKQLNDEYGLRMYSFSDYTPAFIVENMQMIIDAACRGLKSLAYTKDTDYARIFAKTGQAINISCFAKWQDGVYVEDNRQGADWAESKKLREQYKNVGIVMVAVTDNMVDWALKQDWIDVVIPYHIVKTGTTIANEYQWRNFTADSSDKSGNRAANIYPTEHNNDFNTYKRLVEERGLTPRFNDWYKKVAAGELTGDQYMKLVNEVRLPASELSPVVPDFDLDAARESFGVDAEGNVIKGGFVDKGGYMGSWYREGVDVEQSVMQVADDIRAGKKSTEVEYGTSIRTKHIQAQRYGVEKADIEEDIPNSSREYAQMKAEEERAAATPRRKPTATYKSYGTTRMAEVIKGAAALITEDELSMASGKSYSGIKTNRDTIAGLARWLSDQFNLAQEDEADEKRIRAIADVTAAEVISNTYADNIDNIEKLTEEQNLAYRALYVLQRGLKRMSLTDEEVNTIYNQRGYKSARYMVSRWRANKNARKTYLPSQIANELADMGVAVDISADAWGNEGNILIALNRLYKKSKHVYEAAIKEQVGSPDEYADLKKKLSDQIFEAYRDGLTDVRVEQTAAAVKVIADVIRARELSRRKRDTGALASFEWKALLKSIGDILSGHTVSVPGAKEFNTPDIGRATSYNIDNGAVTEFAKKFQGFVTTHMPQLHAYIQNPTDENYTAYKEALKDGDNDLLLGLKPNLAAAMYALADNDPITLSADNLESVHMALRYIIALDGRYNKMLYEGKWREVSEVAQNGIAPTVKTYGTKGDKKLKIKALVGDTLDPYDVARLVSGDGEDGLLAKMVRNLQNAATEAHYKEMQYMREIESYLEKHKDFAKAYKKQRVEFKYSRENPLTGEKVEGKVELTLGEFLSLYMTSKRRHAFLALASSEIVFDKMPGVRSEEQKFAKPNVVYDGLTEAQIEAAVRGMGNAMISQINSVYKSIETDEIRGFIAAVENFFNETSKNEKKIADLQYFGYTNVLESYYFPIERDKNAFDVNLIGSDRILDNMIGTSNFSFNKGTVEKANKPLMIRDALTVVSRHASQLSKYVTMTMPLQNIQRVYNCKISVDNTSQTFKEYIQANVWDGFTNYLVDYLRDVQGSTRRLRKSEELINKAFSAIKSNYAKSVLSFNFKSIMAQFATIFATSTEVSYTSWAKGATLAAFMQRTEDEDGLMGRFDEMDKYSHGAAVRNNSNEMYLATGAMGKLNNTTDKLMILQAVTDRATCFVMFGMCQFEVQKNTGLAVGTVENKIEAGKMLDELILKLQDTSGAATKTGIARSSSEVVSSFALFKSSDLKLWSHIATNLLEMKKLGVTSKRVKLLGKQFGALVTSKIYLIALALLFKKLRGKWEKDKDGKDKSLLDVFLGEWVVESINFVPIAGEIATVALGINGFAPVSVPLVDTINDVATALNSIGDIAVDIIDGNGFDHSRLISVLNTAGRALGFPVGNVKNVMDTVVNGLGLIDSRIDYAYDNFMKNRSATVDDMKTAIESGDQRLAESVADMLMYDRVGSSAGSEAASEIVDLYNSVENNSGLLPSKIADKYSITVNGESTEVELTADQQKKMRTEYGKSTAAVKKLVGSSAYSRLTTEERAAAVKATYKLYMERAKTKVLGADMSSSVAASELMDPTKLICASAHIRAIKSNKSLKNKSAQIKRWLRSQGLSNDEQKLILYMNGYKSEENRRAVERLLRSSKLTKAEKEAIKKALSLED